MRAVVILLNAVLISATFSGCLENLGSLSSVDDNDCDSDDCFGIECGMPSFSSLDNNSNGTLDIEEFVFGLHEYDNQFSLDYYLGMLEELIPLYEDDNVEPVVNETLYNLIQFNETQGFCIGIDCGGPKFDDIDTDFNGIVDSNEFIVALTNIDPRWSDEYQEIFDEFSGNDTQLNESEYYDFYYEIWEDICNNCVNGDNDVNHSEDQIKFSKLKPRCYHIEFFDGSNREFGGWGGIVRFIDGNGVITTIEDFSWDKKYVYLNESTTWTIEYELQEHDVGLIVDGVTYGNDGTYDDESPKLGSIEIDFS